MSWAALFTSLLALAGAVARFLERRRLLRAAEAEAIVRNLGMSHEKLAKALEARRARRLADADADSLREDDGYRRDGLPARVPGIRAHSVVAKGQRPDDPGG